MYASQVIVQAVHVGEGSVAALKVAVVLPRARRSHVVRHLEPFHRDALRTVLHRVARLHVSRELILDRESLVAAIHGTGEVAAVNVSLEVLLQQDFLTERAVAHRTLVPELIVNLNVLLQVDVTHELLLALATGIRVISAVNLQVLLELRLLPEHLVRTVWTDEQVSVRFQVSIQLTDLCETKWTLIAHVLL